MAYNAHVAVIVVEDPILSSPSGALPLGTVIDRVRRPRSNGIMERLHRTLRDEHFRVEGRKSCFETIAEMQVALDAYLVGYNTKRPHQGRGMNGRTPGRSGAASLRPAGSRTKPT